MSYISEYCTSHFMGSKIFLHSNYMSSCPMFAFDSFYKSTKRLKIVNRPIQRHTKYPEMKSRVLFCLLSQLSHCVKCGLISWCHIYHHHKTFLVPAGYAASYQTPWEFMWLTKGMTPTHALSISNSPICLTF